MSTAAYTPAEHRRFMDVYEYIHDVLVDAQRERHSRRFVDTSTGQAGWMVYERLEVWCAVNLLREQYNKREVKMRDVEQKEQMASGHIDYTKKFALGCAELVMAP